MPTRQRKKAPPVPETGALAIKLTRDITLNSQETRLFKRGQVVPILTTHRWGWTVEWPLRDFGKPCQKSVPIFRHEAKEVPF